MNKLINKPTIEDKVKHAISYLSPYFNIEKNRKINYSLFYDSEPRGIIGCHELHIDQSGNIKHLIIMNLKSINDSIKFKFKHKIPKEKVLDYVVGEEVGHMLHHVTNKSLISYRLSTPLGDHVFNPASYLTEFVGTYAALVYANRKGKIISYLNFDHFDHTKLKEVTLHTLDISHRQRAAEIFKKYGDIKLLEFTQMEVTKENPDKFISQVINLLEN